MGRGNGSDFDFARRGTHFQELRAKLRDSLVLLQAEPRPLVRNDELIAALVGLYDVPANEIWREYVERFLAENAAALHAFFDERAALSSPNDPDPEELILVLERLRNDSMRLELSWPLAPSQLVSLGYAWGVPVEC